MANEWKWAQTTWSQSSQNSQVLMGKLEAFMIAAGFVLAAYSTVDNRYYVRADHGSRPNWRYTGDGGSQRGGIYIRDRRYNAGAYNGTSRLNVKAFVENITANGVQVVTPDSTGEILIDFHATKTHVITLIGGEDGLHLEFGVDGLNGNIALGMVMTHAIWPELHGSREPERQFCSQGLVFDLFGLCRMTQDRQYRQVRDDGASLNATGALRVFPARSNTAVTVADRGIVNGDSLPLISWDLFLGMNLRNQNMNSTSTGFGLLQNCCSFGLQSTPFDDRWRLSPLVFLQSYSGQRDTSVFSSSASVSLPASQGFGGAYCDGRNLLRKIPRIFAISHLLAPWQLITDDVTALQYRVVRSEDGGRVVCLGIEWPGALEEVTLP